MANFVIILGKSGTGKSTSIKSLNPEETVIFNVLNKRLPFKGSAKNYSIDKKNLFEISKWDDVINYMAAINDKAKNIKNVIIDDAIYIMRNEFFDRSKEKGFDKYNDLANHFRNIITTCSNLRSDLNVFMMLHSEPEESDGSIIGYKCATIGKLLDKQYNPVESVSIVLYSEPKYDEKGNPTFGFYTHKCKVNGIELPCKTPDEMFDSDFIPNDLQMVIDKMNEYYG